MGADPLPTTEVTYRQKAGNEPLPGYRLIEALGKGGFGEVWKCEAPGGIPKAVKFVYYYDDETDNYQQELAAFEHIKRIRHPFMMSLERAEVVDNALVVVMELADQTLAQRFLECQEQGRTGVPRDELLRYLADVSEALDVIGSKHGLQHLDVKPGNLFLVSGRAKIGDYGLVSQSHSSEKKREGGFTPRYAPPELANGIVDIRSDQYSLALVYFETLTGRFPFSAKSAQQLLIHHAITPPDLSALAPDDRPIVAKALAKTPEERYPSCLEFVRALMLTTSAETPGPAITRLDHRSGTRPRDPRVTFAPPNQSPTPSTEKRSESSPFAPLRTPGKPSAPLQSTTGSSTRHTVRQNPVPEHVLKSLGTTSTNVYAALNGETIKAEPTAEGDYDGRPYRPVVTTLPNGFFSVVPVEMLRGETADFTAEAPLAWDFAQRVFKLACGDRPIPVEPTDPIWLPNGRYECRFPAKNLSPSVMKVKLETICEKWGGRITTAENGFIRFEIRVSRIRRQSWLMNRDAEYNGMTIDVELPAENTRHDDVILHGATFGEKDATLTKSYKEVMPQLLTDVRKLLQNMPNRRKSPRMLYTSPITLYPVTDEGKVFAPIAAQCVDVSPKGISCLPVEHPCSRFMYIQFPEITTMSHLAVLVELVRRSRQPEGTIAVGMYRVDLDEVPLLSAAPAK